MKIQASAPQCGGIHLETQWLLLGHQGLGVEQRDQRQADAAHAENQPILLSDSMDAVNGASMVMFVDGKWRADALKFDRALLLFGAEATEAARGLWRELDSVEDVTREIHKQDESGRWRAGT